MINHLVNVLKSRLIQDKEAKQTIAIVGNMIEIQDDSRFSWDRLLCFSQQGTPAPFFQVQVHAFPIDSCWIGRIET